MPSFPPVASAARPAEAVLRRDVLRGLLALPIVAAACGPDGLDPLGSRSGPWSFTDDRGTAINLPRKPERVVAFLDCAAALWSYGIQPVGLYTWGIPVRDANGQPSARLGGLDLDKVKLFDQGREIDLEALASLEPDLFVSNMWGKDSLNLPGGAAALEKIQAIVPTAGISMMERTVAQVAARYGELAQAIAGSSLSQATASKARFDAACETVRKSAAARPGFRVMFCSPGPDQVWVVDPNRYPETRLLRDLGVTIIDPLEQKQTQTSALISLSWEQIGRYPADLLVNQNAAWTTGTQAIWDGLPAVSAGQVVSSEASGSWYLYTYDNYAKVLGDFASLLDNSRVVA